MAIDFFNHPDIGVINNKLQLLTQNLRVGDTIKAIHTPIVLPLGTSNEIGGYARSIGFSFGPKRIAINCDRLLQEPEFMKEFILARQVALFDKACRCLHLPVAGIAVAIAVIASNVLFPCSLLAAVTIPAVVGLASAVIIAKKERENEIYADLKAFRNCGIEDKKNILYHFFTKACCTKEELSQWYIRKERSSIQQVFSGYPLTEVRHRQLLQEWYRQAEFVSPEDRKQIYELEYKGIEIDSTSSKEN